MSTTFTPRQQDEKAIYTIQDVAQRTVNKKDGTAFTMYDVSVVEQEQPFSTTKREIAEAAAELKGQPAEITYAVKVNGNWTNYYVNGVLPPPVTAAQALQMAQKAAETVQAAPVPSASPGVAQNVRPIPQAQPSEWEKEKSKAIHRQTAAKVAAALAAVGAPASPEDFWRNTLMLASYFDTGALPEAQGGYSDEDVPF